MKAAYVTIFLGKNITLDLLIISIVGERYDYAVFTTPKSWDEANDICNQVPNRRLGYFTTRDEFVILREKAETINNLVWSGLTDLDNDPKNFKWPDGSSASNAKQSGMWKSPNEPDSIDAKCIAFEKRTRKLEDHSCTSKYAFICMEGKNYSHEF